MYVLGVVEVTMKYFEANSVFELPTQDHINCPQYWWRNVLYINTLFPVEDMVHKYIILFIIEKYYIILHFLLLNNYVYLFLIS